MNTAEKHIFTLLTELPPLMEVRAAIIDHARRCADFCHRVLFTDNEVATAIQGEDNQLHGVITAARLSTLMHNIVTCATQAEYVKTIDRYNAELVHACRTKERVQGSAITVTYDGLNPLAITDRIRLFGYDPTDPD